jgi:TorA maturation chaperone TorD
LHSLSMEHPSVDHSDTKWCHRGHVVTLKLRRIWKQLYLHFQLHVIYPTTSISIMLELCITLCSNLLLQGVMKMSALNQLFSSFIALEEVM